MAIHNFKQTGSKDQLDIDSLIIPAQVIPPPEPEKPEEQIEPIEVVKEEELKVKVEEDVPDQAPPSDAEIIDQSENPEKIEGWDSVVPANHHINPEPEAQEPDYYEPLNSEETVVITSKPKVQRQTTLKEFTVKVTIEDEYYNKVEQYRQEKEFETTDDAIVGIIKDFFDGASD